MPPPHRTTRQLRPSPPTLLGEAALGRGALRLEFTSPGEMGKLLPEVCQSQLLIHTEHLDLPEFPPVAIWTRDQSCPVMVPLLFLFSHSVPGCPWHGSNPSPHVQNKTVPTSFLDVLSPEFSSLILARAARVMLVQHLIGTRILLYKEKILKLKVSFVCI